MKIPRNTPRGIWTGKIAVKKPQGYVDGPATVRIVENGPVRVALEVTREARGSKFIQQIRLSNGTAVDRVEFPHAH